MHGALQSGSWQRYGKEYEGFTQWWASRPEVQDAAMALALYVEQVAQQRGPGVAGKVLIMVCRVKELYLDPVAKSPMLAELAKALEKARKLAATPKRVDALDPEWVRVWFASVGGSWSGLTDMDRMALAGLLLGLRAAKRAADLARVRLENVRKIPGKEGWLEVTFPQTKTHPEGEVVVVEPLLGMPQGDAALCPVLRVWQWAELRRRMGASPSDLLFVSAQGAPVGAQFWTRVVKAVATAAGRAGRFSSRSLRVGGSTAMLRAGYTAEETRAVGGWKSDAYMTYLRGNVVATSGLSNKLFGGRTSGTK